MSSRDRPLCVCTHLVAAPEDYHVWFTGSGTDCHWVCPECAKKYPELPTDLLLAADDALLARCREEASWSGICGRPELQQRRTGMRFVQQELTTSIDKWIDIQPDLHSDGQWFVLTAAGDLATTNLERGDWNNCRRLELDLEIDDETALCLSPKSDYVAVYQTSGRFARIFSLPGCGLTAQVDRGDYRPENSRFPIAFFDFEGRTLLVAASDWNRLDVIDPATGAVLTDRTPTSYSRGEARPPHYLDYFHAQLLVSPNGRWILDNGWEWHPWGSVVSWNLHDWLTKNPWESEDGPSRRQLASRAYYWDGPLCWIDDVTAAVWGWGKDEEWLLPAVRLFDVRSGEEIRWFPGPETRRPTAWPPKKVAPSLFFDEYLFSVHDEHGISVWDVSTGEQLLHDTSLAPIHYHPRSKTFLSVSSDGVRLSQLREAT